MKVKNLELEVHLESHTMLMRSRKVVVVQTTDILHMEELQDVVDAE